MPRYQFNQVDVPNTPDTLITAIFGNGTISGQIDNRFINYFTQDPNGQPTFWTNSMTTVVLPGPYYGSSTLINQSGEQVGYAGSTTGSGTLFWINPNTPPIVSGYNALPKALSDTGYITGNTATAPYLGFLKTPTNGYTTFSAPGASYTTGNAVANNGIVVGDYTASDGTPGHTFERKADGSMVTFDVPHPQEPAGQGGQAVNISGVNSQNWIVGSFNDGMHSHGFLISPDGVVDQVDVPGSSDTFLDAINDQGEIGGYFDNTPYNGTHGFIAEQPSGHMSGPGVALPGETTHVIGHVNFLTS